MRTMKIVLLVLFLLILAEVSNEKKMKCVAHVSMWWPTLSECYTSKKADPLLKIKHWFIKFYNKHSRVIFQSHWIGGFDRYTTMDVNVDYDPETDGVGLQFYVYHKDDQSMNDNPVKSGYFYRTHYDEPENMNKAYGQGTDLSQLYYRRAGVILPTVTVNCSGTTYPLWKYEPHHCKIAELVVGNHGAYDVTGNPPLAVPLYFRLASEGDLYYF